MDRGHLYHLWEAFLGIPRDLPTEEILRLKDKKLKMLLGMLLEIVPKSSENLHELLDIHSVSNVLIQEFLADIKDLSGENSHANFPMLLNYLSLDRGAVMIIIMAVIGIRDLIHGPSLGKCLILLLKQIITSKSSHWSTMSQEIHLTGLELFVIREPRYRKLQVKELEDTLRPGTEREDDETSDPDLSSSLADVKAPSRRVASARLRKHQKESKDMSDSDTDDSKKLLVVFREMRRRFRNVPDLTENFISNLSFHSLATSLVNDDDPPKIELTASELCLLLASVLKDICFDDDQFREEKSTCMHLLPNFEELLNILIDEMYEVKGNGGYDARTENSLGVIGQSLLRIFVALTSKISSQIDGLLVLHSAKTPNSWLTKLSKHLNADAVNSKEKLLLSYDVVRTCLLYAETVLSSVRLTPLRLASALDATEFVLHNCGLELLETVLLRLNEESVDEQSAVEVDRLLDSLLVSVRQVIGLLKLLRARYIHLLTCPKRVHRQCSSFMSYAHHHDVLGLASCQSFESSLLSQVGAGKTNSDICVVALSSLVLVGAFRKSHDSTKLRILSTLAECGTCCCVSLEMFAKSLLNALAATLEVEHKTSHYLVLCREILSVVTNFFLVEFGGVAREVGSISTTVRCTICMEEVADSTSVRALPYSGGKMETSDSALSDSDSHGGLDSMSCSRWSCLKLLLPYLSCENEVVARHTKRLVCDLVQKSNSLLRYEILYFIFLPVLQEAERYLMREFEENDAMVDRVMRSPVPPKSKGSETICYSLFILPDLLTSCSACELFVASNGFSMLENLARDRTIQICVVLTMQRLAFVQDFQAKQDKSSHLKKSLAEQDSAFVKEPTSSPNNGTVSVAASSCSVLIKLLFENLHNSAMSFKDIAMDRLCHISVVWKTVNSIIKDNELLRNLFIEEDGPDIARAVLTEGVKLFLRHGAPHVTTQLRLDFINDQIPVCENLQELHSLFSLVCASLGIVLYCAQHQIKFGLKNLTVDDVVSDLGEVIVSEVKANTATDNTLKLLCEMILMTVNDDHACRKNTGHPSYDHLENSTSDWETVEFDRGQSSFVTVDSVADSGYYADCEMASVSSADDSGIPRGNSALLANVGAYPELCKLLLRIAKERLSISTSFDTFTASQNLQSNQQSQDEESELDSSNVKPELNPKADDFVHLKEMDSGRNVAACILRRIASQSKSCVTLIDFVYRQNLVEELISLYRRSHSSDVEISRDVLRVLLDLVVRVSEFGLSPKSLSSYLSLFNDGENLDLLLSVLNAVIINLPHEPKYSLRMPVNISPSHSGDLVVLSCDIGAAGREAVSDSTSLASGSSFTQNSSPEKSTMHGAVKALLRNTTALPGVDNGKLSVAFWIMLETSRSSGHSTDSGHRSHSVEFVKHHPKKMRHRFCLRDSAFSESAVESHVLSVGDSELMLQVWIKDRRAGLAVRVTSLAGGLESILCEDFLHLKIVRGKWHHIVLTYEQLRNNDKDGKTSSNISIYLDGLSKCSSTMKWTSRVNVAAKNPSSLECSLSLGHSSSGSEDFKKIYYQLGAVFLFQDLLLSELMSFYLFCLGPDCVTLNQCDSSDLNPTYQQQSCALAVDSKLPAQDMEPASLAVMRASLLLTYTPSHPDVFGFMKDYFVDTSVRKNARHSNPPAMNDFTLQPMWIRVQTLLDQKPIVHQETISSIRQLGGIGTFVYLFAKVVEFGTCESDQSEALQVVFNLLQRDRILLQEFIKLDGYAMIVKVLLTTPCIIGFQILKVLLNASVTAPVLLYDRVSKSYSLNTNTTLLIRDVHVITDIIFAWTVWNKAPDDVWLLGLRAIHSLIQPKHLQREFNVRALLAVGAVEKLFNICLERLQMSYPSLSLPLCRVFLDIVRDLISVRPDIHHVLQICDFLLLTHPASNTFVFHNATTFCFRNKWISGDRPTSIAFEGNKVIIPGPNEDSKQRNSPDISDAVKFVDSVVPESCSMDPKVTKGNSTVNGSAFQGLTNGDVIDNKMDDVSVDFGDGNRHAAITRNVDLRGGDGRDADNMRDFDVVYNRSILTVEANQGDAGCGSGRSPEAISQDVSGISALTGDVSGVVDLLQDEDECAEVYQHEVIGSSVTPVATTATIEDELSSLSDAREELGVDSAGISNGGEGFPENLHRRASVSVDTLSVSETIEEDGDEDRDVCDAALLDVVDKDDKGLVRIIIGLLELIIDLLPSLKTMDLDKIFKIVLRPQVLVVMAHHVAAEIRITILRMVKCYLKLCSFEQRESFVKHHICHLVANQLHQHSSNRTIIEECLSILIGQSVHFDEIMDFSLPIGLPLFQQMSVSLLLSVLESTTSDPLLCHRLLLALQKIFTSVLDVSQVMLENGLAEVLCNAIHRLGFSWFRDQPADTVECSDGQAVTEGIQTMFCLIAQKTFCTTGSSFFQQFEETFILLKCLETRLKSLHGKDSSVVSFVVTIQCGYLQTIFEDILQNFSSSSESSFGLSAIQTTASRENLMAPQQQFLTNDSSSDASGRSTPRRSLVIGNFEVSLTPGELSDRFKRLVAMAVDYVLFQGNDGIVPRSRESSPEAGAKVGGGEHVGDRSVPIFPSGQLGRLLMVFLMQAVELSMRKGKKTAIGSLMSQTKDVIRKELSRLLLYFLLPSAGLEQNLFAIETFNQKPSNMDILKLLFTISDIEQRLPYYAYFLVTSNVNVLTRNQRNELAGFIDRLGLCNFEVIRPGANLSADTKDRMKKNMEEWGKKFQLDRREWLKKEGRAFQRVLHRLDVLSRKLSSLAMEFTQTVNNDQNKLRKKFIKYMKSQMSDRLQVKKSWQLLISQLSHERGVWHCAELSPHSWQLDPTEGPSRQRCRLSRCHLKLDKRFFLPEQQCNHDGARHELPLSFLFHDDKLGLDSAAVIYKLHTSENIEYTCMCRHVTPQTTTSGVLLMGQTVLYYVADEAVLEDNYTQALLGNCDDLFMTLPHDDIIEFRKQWYLLRDEALEIFLSNGKTCLLALNSAKDRDELHQKLMSLDLPNVQSADNLQHAQVLWLEGSMTNFEYLMHLNKMAGRSFNDLMQYPVFPFILSQYTESTLDLEKPSSYRTLSKTISTQFKEQEDKYIQLYQLLIEQKLTCSATPDILLEPYHYTNHYSNVATVLQFLVRLPPFTQMFIDFQDKNFDCADRMFHSIQISYNLVTKMSMTDSKELIPEFFYLPEFLENSEGFNFGVRQNGQVVSDVNLPPWCQNNARLFTLIHRQALESELVTRSLASWIDLVFGYKQRGKAAIDAINVFRPLMYFGIDVDAIQDELTRKAVKTMIRTHGQTPKQLFKNPHPSPQIRPRPAPTKNKPSPLPQISGLRWGDYVGSPDCPNPVIVSCESWKVEVSSLVALPTGEVYGLGSNCCFLVKQKGMKLMQPIGLNWAAVLSWGHRDAIIRLKNNPKRPPVNFLHWNPTNQVTCAASLTNCCQIYFGTELGNIVALSTRLNSSKPSHLQVFDHHIQLFGHRGRVSCLCICQSFSILVSASLDSTCIIWDLNRLCYVRSISDHRGNVRALCVSNYSGDIASVSDTDDSGSCLMIHTVNARFIAKVQSPDRILCVTFSPRPEGQSVNVIAGGLSSGRIRLWSSWDLTPVRDLVPSKAPSPVLSVAFSQDGQNLFSLMRGLLTVWGNKSSNQRTKKFNFIPLL